MNYSVEQVKDIVREAEIAAAQAAEEFFQKSLGGVDQYACGFAWVDIYGVPGNTKQGRAFKAAGMRKDWTGKAWQIWNPSKHGAQNVDTKEAGAQAAAKVFRKYGFEAYAGSRLD